MYVGDRDRERGVKGVEERENDMYPTDEIYCKRFLPAAGVN